PGEPVEAKVKLSHDGLEAVSDWLPARPLRPEGDSSRLRLCYEPAGDGLAALATLFSPTSTVDRERLASAVAPAGWCSWYELFGNVTEADVIANVEFCAANFDRRFFRYIQLDDGYQKATGDGETNDKFPHGHRRRGPLRRPDPRRGLPQGARGAPRRPRHGGVPGRMRGAAAARRWVRERDADRNRCGRRLGRGAGAGSRRRLAQLLSPSHLAQRPRLPRRAPPTLRERGAGMGRARGRLGRSHSLFRQPPEAATPPCAPAPAHGSRRP